MTKWTIGIITMPSRKLEFARMYGMLKHQIGNRDIEILVDNRHPKSYGDKRQWCLDNASGEYFSQVDDDDIVAHNFIDSIYPLLDGVDQIGFRMQHYWLGTKSKPTYHSLQYKGWYDDVNGFYREISHLNPLKTEIARMSSFAGGYGEDHLWASRLFGIPKTEHYIPEPMYFYFDSSRTD